MLTVADRRPFDLYIRARGGQKVLLCASGVPLRTRDVDRLARDPEAQLYVHMSEYSTFSEFIEDTLSRVLYDKRISVEKKSEMLYDSARAVMSDIVETPASHEVLRKSTTLAEHVLHVVVGCEGGLGSLLNIFGADYYTYTHMVNTCILGAALCQRICTTDRGLLVRYITGYLLHDIGKSFVPSKILNKPDELTQAERRAMNHHATLGYELFRRRPEIYVETLDVILSHHERCDGSGYPNGLRGAELTTATRIAGVIDVFDALTHARQYRPALPHERAFEIMRSEVAQGKLDGDVFAELKTLICEPGQTPSRG